MDAGCNAAHETRAQLQCDAAHRDAVLKDRCGPTRYLLIPTARRSGVESPELLRDDEPNYFADAWSARDRVIRAAGRPEAGSEEIGLAVNSRRGRSQEQLHIHIDFVDPAVRLALARWLSEGQESGRIELAGHVYRVSRLSSLGLPTPFQRLAVEHRSALQAGRVTIAVIGDGATGFFLLSGEADALGLDRGHAEELLIAKRCGG